MRYNTLIILALFVLQLPTLRLDAQEYHQDHYHDVYELDYLTDGILLGTGLLTSYLGIHLRNNQEPPTLAEINNLDRNNLWGIDRSATSQYSSAAQTTSDIILYSAAALPFAIYLTDRCRGEELKLLLMTTETFLITFGVNYIFKASTNRYRPFAYNPQVPEETKLGGSAKRSFFSGHAASSAAFSFFAAKVMNDMHPHWTTKKYITWGVAATLPAVISYGRYKAGKHFFTDLLTGYLFGAATGIIIPHIHKKKNTKIGIGFNSLTLSTRF